MWRGQDNLVGLVLDSHRLNIIGHQVTGALNFLSLLTGQSFFIIKIYLFYVYECFPTYMYVCHVCAWCLRKSEDIGSPGVGVTDDKEPSCGYWEPNSGPLQEQPGI